jgi:hypothetical protein
MKVGEIGQQFLPKAEKIGHRWCGVPSDIAMGIYAADRITSEALPKCGLLPEVELSGFSSKIRHFKWKSSIPAEK